MPIYTDFFFNDTSTTEIYTLSLHDALPISILGIDVFADGLWVRSRALSASPGPAQLMSMPVMEIGRAHV